jgi:hypothetical protein
MQPRWVRAGLILGLSLVTLPHCSDGSEERLTAVKLAGQCALDSECEPPLVCAFERCHWECKTDRDCREKNDKNAGRCVKTDGADGPGVCQLADEAACDSNADCRPGPQVCASDRQCRDVCSAVEPCSFADLVCSAGGFCARAQEVGTDGRLDAEDDSRGGSGSVAAGGATSGVVGSGGAPGVEASRAGAPNTGLGEAGQSSASGEQAGAAGIGGQGGASLPSEVGELEPNDDKASPNALEVGVDVLGELSSSNDRDFFAFVSPDDPGGGYFEIAVTDLPKGLFTESVSLDGESILQGMTSKSGDAYKSYVAALPGRSYVVELAPFQGGQPYTYRLSVKYTPSLDAYEPNDTRDRSAVIERNVPVEALLFAGARPGGVTRAAYDDWYAVELEVGQVVASLTSTPAQTSTEIYLHDPSGGQLAFDVGGAQQDLSVTYAVTKAGTYYVRVGSYVPIPAAVGKGELPTHFTHPYVLKVEQ